jgi:hypothetical protein
MRPLAALPFLLVIAPRLHSQAGDVYASDTYWDRNDERAPECSGLNRVHYDLTQQAYSTRDPRLAKQISDQRAPIGKDLQQCVAQALKLQGQVQRTDSAVANRPGSWQEWSDDYNRQVRAVLDSFGSYLPDRDNQYTYYASVRTMPNGSILVGKPGGTYGVQSPGHTLKDVERIWEQNRDIFKSQIEERLKPLPFPAGSQLGWWEYPVTFLRSKTPTPFSPAPVPREPKVRRRP